MTRQSNADWQRLINACERSGKTQKAFCDEQGISVWMLRSWRKKLTKATTSSSFVEVATIKSHDLRQATSGICRISVNGYSIDVSDGVSSETVVTVLRAMEALCGPISVR